SRGAVRRNRDTAACRIRRRPHGADRVDSPVAVPAAPPFRRGGVGGARPVDPRQGHRSAVAGAPGRERRERFGDRFRADRRRAAQPPRRPTKPRDADTVALEAELATALGLRITLSPKRRGGSLTLHYSSLDQLDRVLALLRRQ